jgi:NAD(P)-dependent dehydrogenase (short-subunit alcohol dehydrogenase family)
VDVDPGKGNETVDSIANAGGKARFYQCDVGKLDQIERTYNAVVGDFGRLDVLVNNCGVACSATVPDTSEDDWRRVMGINLDAVFRFSRLAVSDMLKRKDGAIINISSIGGIVGGPAGAAYCTSKFGIIGLTRSMAADHAKDGIRINCVAPGVTCTEMAKEGFESTGNYDKAKADLEKALPIGRMAQPREIAAGVLFFASALASYCAGVVLPVDGGVTECFWPHRP